MTYDFIASPAARALVLFAWVLAGCDGGVEFSHKVFNTGVQEQRAARAMALNIIDEIGREVPHGVGWRNQVAAWTQNALCSFQRCPDDLRALKADGALGIWLYSLPYKLAQANPGVPVGVFQERLPSRWSSQKTFTAELGAIKHRLSSSM